MSNLNEQKDLICDVCHKMWQLGWVAANDGNVTAMLDAKGVKYEISGDLKAATAEADAVYMTRIQDEWDSAKGESAKIDTSRFKFG